MFHQVFDTRINGRAKRIGILGERHAYTQKESEFGGKVVSQYSNVGIEQVEKFSTLGFLSFLPFVVASIPVYIEARVKYNRSIFFDKAEEYAQALGKKVILLDVEPRPHRLIVSPLVFLYSLISRRPESDGEKMEEMVILDDEKYLDNNKKKSKLDKITDWVTDLDRRDEAMAGNAFRFLEPKYRDNLLINCGMAHVPGIRRNLEGLTDGFKLVSTEVCR